MSNLRREPGAFFFLPIYILPCCSSNNWCLSHHCFCFTHPITGHSTSSCSYPSTSHVHWVCYPIDYIFGWSRWINYIDPIAYVFESLIINEVCPVFCKFSPVCSRVNGEEFAGRGFLCTSFIPSNTVPGHENTSNVNRICLAVGAVPGNQYFEGTDYIKDSFQYESSHKWRNIGIVIGFIMYVIAPYGYTTLTC